jgi:MFS transporter, FSR family, fosmidomycin resistance protein
LGPVFATSVISLAGLELSYCAALPGIVMSVFLIAYGPSPRRVETHTRRMQFSRQLRTKVKPLLMLYFLVVIRSAIQIVFVSFMPIYLTGRGFSELQASQALTLFLLAGGSAGFLGGILADRFGGRTIIALSMLGCFPMLAGFLWTSGATSIALCAAGGAFLLFTTSVNIVMAQNLVPEGASTVSALMMGFAWGMGGLFVPLVGILSDRVGLQVALSALVCLAIPGFVLAMLLPSRRVHVDTGIHLEPLSELPPSGS